MLTVVELASWSDFQELINKRMVEETQQIFAGPFFYRGQADAAWGLETTLERYGKTNQSVTGYYSDIHLIKPQIETFTDRNWDLPDDDKYEQYLESGGIIMTDPIVNYMQYLRHYGYPSPLLDWTLSPFVAAYFAFRDVSNKSKFVAIYQFLVTSFFWGQVSYGSIMDNPVISPVTAVSLRNKRHYLQQSIYTVCLKKEKDQIYYVSHEDPWIIGHDDEHGSSGAPITKYILPASERKVALNSLDAYNINAYSLVGTERDLLETLYLRQYKRDEINKYFLDL